MIIGQSTPKCDWSEEGCEHAGVGRVLLEFYLVER